MFKKNFKTMMLIYLTTTTTTMTTTTVTVTTTTTTIYIAIIITHFYNTSIKSNTDALVIFMFTFYLVYSQNYNL